LPQHAPKPAQPPGRGARVALSPQQKLALLRRHLHRRYRTPIATIETHFAWVLLTRRLAFKLKKPLRQWPMDYRALSARRWGCWQELRLNRRLAPAVYRSVEPLVRTSNGTLRLGGRGHVEDYVIRMRRLPARQMLDHRIGAGLRIGQLERLIEVLARFFSDAAPRPMTGADYLHRLRRQIEEDRRALRQGAGLAAVMVDHLCSAQRRLLQAAAPQLARRGARLVDGHGDLRAEHVHLGRSVQIIDCLEFDRELRRLDPLQEVAQLALEIDSLGKRPLARQLLQRYCEYSAERIGPAELWFYVSRNALTRAKLAVWHIGDPQFPDAAPWRRRAHRYLRQARWAIGCADRALARSAPPARTARRPHGRRPRPPGCIVTAPAAGRAAAGRAAGATAPAAR
jgi:uncharacterized protein